MKIEMTKHSMTRLINADARATLEAAGWVVATPPVEKEKAGEEVIRLKQPVKSKATVTALEEANITNKGDE